MTINAKDLKTIKSNLAQRRKARLAAADDRSLSTKETILRLAPELRKMKRQGFSTAELVDVLKGHGLGIKGATLNRYLAESRPPKAKTDNGHSRNIEEKALAGTSTPTAETPESISVVEAPSTKRLNRQSAPVLMETAYSAATPRPSAH